MFTFRLELNCKYKYIVYLKQYYLVFLNFFFIFRTGQGVVTERSPYTDSAFAYAMMKSGYIPPRGMLLYMWYLFLSVNF